MPKRKDNNRINSNEETKNSFEIGNTTGYMQKTIEVQDSDIKNLKIRVKRLERTFIILGFITCVWLVTEYRVNIKEIFSILLRLLP